MQAPAPYRPIEKSFAGASLLALVLSWKYAFHLPLHRQCQIFAHAGLTVSRTTLMQWVAGTSTLFLPPKEVLTIFAAIEISRGKYEIYGFDDTYYDLLHALRVPPTQGGVVPELLTIAEDLDGLMRETQGLMKDFRSNPKKFLHIKIGLF